MTARSEQFQGIADWLGHGAPAPLPSQAVKNLCERLVEAGLPLWRMGLFVRTLHPDIYGRNFIWRRGGGVAVGSADFEIRDTPEYRSSPLRAVFEDGREVRCRLEAGEGRGVPFYDEMRAEGLTDYIALPLLASEDLVHATSWTTRDPGGFTDQQLADLRSLMPPFTRVVEIIGLRRVASTLLNTYVGSRAGERILAGAIRRGYSESMRAAIWLSDMRGFTTLSDRLPPETIVAILNRYFDCQVPAIREHGGEVLKFMGDGLLAVFPIADDESDVADVSAQALEAARSARAGVAALRFDCPDGTVERFRFGVALHVGRVLYGNIGGSDRLDFTCIGPAVNLAARMEKIASRLGRTVVASDLFAGHAAGDWRDLGEFPVAGFSAAQRVYGLADEGA